MPSFSRQSMSNLSSCCREVQMVMHRSIRYTDFTIVQGFRDEETQNRYYERGVSQVKWPNSKHNSNPSKAVDVAPYHPTFGILFGSPEQLTVISQAMSITKQAVNAIILREYFYLAGVIMCQAQELQVEMRWGGDWDRDKDYFDNKFNDLGHFEIVGV